MKVMTNKEFQEALKVWPDDYYVCVDKTFGWNLPDNINKVDPYLWVNSDTEEIEIGTESCAEMDLETITKVMQCASELHICKSLTSKDLKHILKRFYEKHEAI